MSHALDRLAEAVRRETGIHLKRPQWPALGAALGRAVPGLDPDAAELALDGGEEGALLLERVIDELTVKESSFMREAGDLEALDWAAMLERARARGDGCVRVWSAACAGGQEPYTLALLASEAFASDHPPVRVLATDISATALDFARRGCYGRRAIRNVAPATIARHFRADGDQFVVADALRELVTFRRHSLARDPAPPAGEEPLDLILCRNVLIYLEPEAVERTVRSLQDALQPEGELLLGAADRLCLPWAERVRVPRQEAPVPPGRRAAPVPGTASGGAPAPAPRARPAQPRQDERPRATATPARAPEPAAPAGPAPGLAAALAAAGEGRLEAAIAASDELLAQDPANVGAHFVRATAELAAGNAAAAVASLRAALYLDPGFGIAAFKLARAYDALGDTRSARREYERALRTLDPDDRGHAEILGDVDPGDVALACAARLRALAAGAGGGGRR